MNDENHLLKDISIWAVDLLTEQMWINPVTLIQKCDICILKIENTIFHQINVICNQKSLLSQKIFDFLQ